MIFVTVGTHEQPFDRLMKAIDSFAEKTDEKIIVQYGYSNYIPKNCITYNMISSDDMTNYVNEARIVITHGGPGSIMLPLLKNKKPIVVPRQHAFGEHVNDHQVLFTKFLEKDNKVIAIYDIDDLETAILKYDKQENFSLDIEKNIHNFNTAFEKEINKLVGLQYEYNN